MPSRYSLRENHLTSDPDDYMAYTEATVTIDEKDLIKDMINRGSTVTEADIVSVFRDALKSIKVYIAQGASLKLSFGNYSTSIKGVFTGREDSYDPSRHQISLNIQPGAELKEFISGKMPTEKVEAVLYKPSPAQFIDVYTGEKNSVATPGGMAQITGYRLKYDPANDGDGIRFIKADGTAVKVSMVGLIKPTILMFNVPAELTSGEYTVQISATTGNELRSGELPDKISIA